MVVGRICLGIVYVAIFLLQLALPGVIEEKASTLQSLQANQSFEKQYLEFYLEEWYFLKAFLSSFNVEFLEKVPDFELVERIDRVALDEAKRLIKSQEEFAASNRTDATFIAQKAKVIINITDDLKRLVTIINKYKFADDEVKFGNLMQAARDRLEQEKRGGQNLS